MRSCRNRTLWICVVCLVAVWGLVQCASSPQSPCARLPSFLPRYGSIDTIFSLGSFRHVLQWPAIPASSGSGQIVVAVAGDSVVAFCCMLPSKQGAVIAFEEWIPLAEQHAASRDFPKGIGKKALLFQNRNGTQWVVFYQNTAVFGLGMPAGIDPAPLARKWAQQVP